VGQPVQQLNGLAEPACRMGLGDVHPVFVGEGSECFVGLPTLGVSTSHTARSTEVTISVAVSYVSEQRG